MAGRANFVGWDASLRWCFSDILLKNMSSPSIQFLRCALYSRTFEEHVRMLSFLMQPTENGFDVKILNCIT